MRICVVGDPEDLTLVYLRHCAQRRGVEVLDLPEEGLGEHWAYTFDDEDPGGGHFITGEGPCSFLDVAGVFVRFNSEPSVPPHLADLPAERQAVLIGERRSALQHLLNRFPRPVVNPPSAGRSNGSKPFQMRRLAHAGFAVPRWIASNDREVVRAFADTCPQGAIYKSCSGLRSHVRMLDDEVLERLQEGTSPIVVQDYVAGYDVRLHTVLDRPFATKITAEGVDYRFASSDSRYEAISAPEATVALCQRVAAEEGLVLAGFDFRVAADGTWYCLEVNPVPTFLPYEMTTGQPIAEAILDLFAGQTRAVPV